MNSMETRLIEEGWAALVDRLGLTEATRFVLLLDRRTGGAMQHLHTIQSGTLSGMHRRYSEMQSRTTRMGHYDEIPNQGHYS